jgi:hypothetical protein
MDDPTLTLTPEERKWTARFFATLLVGSLILAMCWLFSGHGGEVSADEPKPPGKSIVISGTIEDVQMFRANDSNCAVLIKFRDGRLLKTWCVNYNYHFIFHVGKYNNVVLDCNGNGGIADVQYEPGITD